MTRCAFSDDDDDDKVIENERPSLRRKIDPVKAKVNLLIRKKLERKKEEKYKRKRRSALDTIEYYDYDDDDEEQVRDAPVNEPRINNEDDKLFKDEAKTKRGKNLESVTTNRKMSRKIYREFVKLIRYRYFDWQRAEQRLTWGRRGTSMPRR